MTPIRQDVAPFGAEQTERHKADFNRDGFLHIPDVLEPDEVATLNSGIERFVPVDLAEKVINCRDLLDRWLSEQRVKWRL